MDQYVYEGPVLKFDKCIDQYFKAVTFAVSEKKARSNLAYRYKKDHGLMPNTNITLPGKISKVQ